ncbi:MAG: MFS transporter, partial [Collinsella sp.]
GFQTSYFIGVIGTLTYADDASVVATSLAVLFMNVFVILGSFAGGAALDAWGPRRHFLLSIVGTLATGAAILAFGSATGTVLAGAVLLGFVMGFAQPIATSYPAYLTDDPVELKDINSAIAMFSNVSIIVGPTLGGFVAAAASSRAVFVLMMLFTVLALVAGWGFRPQAGRVAARESTPADSSTTASTASQSSDSSKSTRATFATSIKTVFTNSVLALLFCIIFLSNFGYGAFDRWSRSSTAMSCTSVSSGWAGSRRPAVWARCWAPSSRSACRRASSALKRCLWRLCPWAWEACSTWERRTWA